MNILLIKTSAIGDVTHALPAASALRRHYPGAHIAWVVEEAAADLVLGHAAVDRVLVVRRRWWLAEMRRGRVLGALREIRRFVRELRDTRYDLLLDLQGLLKSSVWVVLARAERKVGFGRGMEHAEGSWMFLNERVPAVDMDVHALDRGLILLEHIGVPRGPVAFDLPIGPVHEARAREMVEEATGGRSGGEARAAPAGKEGALVVVSPVAKWPTKLWETERFAEVADRLMDAGCAVVFTGAAEDAPVIDEIAGHMRHEAARVDGRTDLKTLAALLRAARVVLTTDSGPMHIAAAVGTPVVALFGPTAPWRTGPYGPRHTVLRVELSCSPCLKKRCATTAYEKLACMKRIGVGDVVEAVLARITPEPGRPVGDPAG